jgi:condensin complex subunit 2
LDVKSLDLEFEVDPLFKKTAADFDEGGAKGLLLNHLFISNTGKIIFDASDANELDNNPEPQKSIEISVKG